MAKIDIISGFLGAGKTTLIQKLLKEALKGEKVVLIENEFGEIGIDGGFLKDAGIEVTEMNSGCICCSLVGDFGSALKEVVTQYNPDRIIIEPSGVGKLSDVIKAVQGVAEDVELDLNSFVTVADAKKCKMYMKNFGEFYNNQVEYAGSIILSRTGDVAEDKLNESVALLREHNEKAAIITTPWDELSGEQILKVMEDGNDMVKELLEEEEICPVCGGHHDHEHHHDHDHEHHHHDHDEECSCGCGHDHDHHHHHHADEVFTSWGRETAKKYTKELLETSYQQAQNCHSGNEIIDSIINCKMNEATNQNIEFNHKILLNTKLNISFVDICAILANQIDNALEACAKISIDKERSVKVQIWQKESFVFFKVINTVDKNPFDSLNNLKSTKDNSDTMHGLGIKNIRETAAKYDGFLKNNYIDGYFISLVMVSNHD